MNRQIRDLEAEIRANARKEKILLNIAIALAVVFFCGAMALIFYSFFL